MTKRLFLYLLGLVSVAGLLTSCAKDEKFTQISSLSFSAAPSSMAPGQTHKLQVRTFPAGADEPYTLVFTSSKPAVATVDDLGTITAIQDGQTVITVSLKDRPEVKAELSLTVETIRITGVEFTEKVSTLFIGQTFSVSTRVLPENATESGAVEYVSSQPEVASITQTGYITALEAGTTVITVTVKEHPEIKAEFTLAVKPLYKAPKNTKFQKVAYFPSYRDLTEGSIPDEKLQMVDVACFAFASINDNYTLSVQEPDKLRALVARCKAFGVKILLSLNGTHSLYAAMTASPENRAKFIASLKTIVETYDLDGVDNDWEYPKTSDNSHKGNTALMRELSSWLHDPAVNKLLTMAITPGKYEGVTSNGIEQECFDYVDWFNVMVYDDFSNDTPGINHSPFELLEVSYNYWVVKRSMPKYKFVAGIPVYGRSSGLGKSISMTYASILAQGGNPDANQATVTSSSYNNGQTPFVVYYNGRVLVRQKTRYCIDQGLGGVMFWEAGQDTQDDRSLIKAAYEEVDGYTVLP